MTHDQSDGLIHSRSCPRRQIGLGAGVDPAWAYLQADLATATPQRLWMLLYDGAVRLCRQALVAMDQADLAAAAEMLSRARAVFRQLEAALPGQGDPDARRQLAGLYDQAHRCLIDADFYRRRESLSRAISLLDFQRPAWGEFLQAASRQEAASPRAAPRGEWVG